MDRNPERGCGTKTNDSFYLEGEVGTEGGLWAWTWFLGDGLDHVLLVSRSQVPTRSTVVINPAATLAHESFVGGDLPFSMHYAKQEQRKKGYGYFLGKTRDIGSVDHVGRFDYTPWSFAEEVIQHGPSRKINKQMAKVFSEIFTENGPFPMLFSHTQIPMFAGYDHKIETYNVIADVIGKARRTWLDACWEHDEWGQYSVKGQTPGNNSFLVPILRFMDMLKKIKPGEPMPDDEWAIAKQMIDKLRYEDQIYGASWMTKVTYTLPAEGKDEAREKVLKDIPGIDILDLEEYEYEQRITKSEGSD